MHQIVVNGLWNADKADVAVNPGCISGQLAHGIHGIVAADIEEPANVHFFEFLEQPWINFVCERFGKFVAAGAEISCRCVGKKRKLLPGKCFLKIQHGIV